ncbi:MAG TPA: glutamate-cysteine ligase family protein [Thiobacillaceae bacterium]|nr:glutamate-cysteine ligase family protein [Thiobacillaceae bacterium]
MSGPALHAFAGWGIELEYMIVDRHSLAVRPIADALLRDANGRPVNEVARDGMGWSNELVLHLLEIKNLRPTADLAALTEDFRAEVRAVNAALAPLGARLMPGGAHPWMDPASETRLWPHENADIYLAYDRIFGCRTHGFANLQSMHLNLPFAGDAEFARLHAAVRLLLPILPALAAASPIVDGGPASWLDARLAAYREHQMRVPASMGRVVPDTASGRGEYETRVLAPMYRDIAPLDPAGTIRHEWLNARGAIPRFERSALEIRLIDAQECPRADLAIAAAVTAAARALYEERYGDLAAQQAMPTDALAAILDTCIRAAEAATIPHPDYLRLLGLDSRPRLAGELWQRLIEASPPGSAWDAPLQVILERGPLARRILRATGPHPGRPRLAAVYGELCDCLDDGRLFTP